MNLSSDDKMQFIEAKHGIIGYAVFCKLLEKIYKNGYYCKWEPRDEILFSKTNGVEYNTLKEIISDCINEGLFSANLYKDYSILTSASIQMRYVMGSMKRKNVSLIKDFLCMAENSLTHIVKVTLTDVHGEIMEVISVDSTQSKVKESKEKESSVCEISHTLEFETLHNFLKTEKDFTKLKEYDLEYYFHRVINFYPGKNFTQREVKAKIIYFIENDRKSDKHEPRKITKPKSDSITVAYELVQSNLDWIKNLPDKNPDEVIPELIKKCRDPARKDTLFEAYVEKALRHYFPT